MKGAISKTFLRCLIGQHTRLSRDHLTPELVLHLLTPACHLWHANHENSPLDDPFWAFYWPGGQALTRYILDNPGLFQGKRVLDLGSGCGSAAIAATLAGASEAVANDIDPVAEVAVEMNMEKNGVKVKPETYNYLTCEPRLLRETKKFDIILIGDMFYDPDFTHLISQWLRSIHPDSMVLIGDPGRVPFNQHPMKSCLKLLHQYSLRKTSQLENNGLTEASIWLFDK
ncbi:hypothetical protein EGW08_008936, partial [Elysia chlorotica]